MATYHFPIVLVGTGDMPEDAWNDAVEGFCLDPGCFDKYEIVEEDEEN